MHVRRKEPVYEVEDAPDEVTEEEKADGRTIQLAPGNKVLRDENGKVVMQLTPEDFEMDWEVVPEE